MGSRSLDKIKPPQVFAYMDFRQFLADYYQAKNSGTQSFSYGQWANLAGFKSRSFIRLIILGKRNLTEQALPRLTQSLKLSRLETLYFQQLVYFNQAATLDERDRAWSSMMQIARGRSDVPGSDVNLYHFLSSWLGPVIYAYLTLEDVDRSVAAIAEHFSLTKQEVSEVLENFQALELADCEKNQWRAKHAILQIPDRLSHMALQSFHRKSLDHALKNIEQDVSKRHFLSNIHPLSKAEYREFVEECKAFTERMLSRFSAERSCGQRRMYQLNLNIVPLSSSLIQSVDLTEPEPDRTHDLPEEVANEAKSIF